MTRPLISCSLILIMLGPLCYAPIITSVAPVHAPAGGMIYYVALTGDDNNHGPSPIDGSGTTLPDDLVGLFDISNKSYIQISGLHVIIKLHNVEVHDADGADDDNISGLNATDVWNVEIYDCSFHDNRKPAWQVLVAWPGGSPTPGSAL